jgi:type III secretory pathway component EscU
MNQDLKLYILNAGAFSVSMMEWLEPLLKITLLSVTIGYTLHKWWKLKNK